MNCHNRWVFGWRVVRVLVAGLLVFAATSAEILAMASPRGSDVSLAVMESALRYSEKQGGHALLISQYGRIVHESYSPGFGAAEFHPVYSITKSLAALGCLSAVSEGRLDLDEPVANVITEWQGDARKKKITTRQLLDQTAGLSPGFPVLYAPGIKNKNQRAMRLPMVAGPGERFDYGPSYFEVIEELMRRKFPIPPRSFLESRVLSPAKASVAPGWQTDLVGNAYFSTGAAFTARGLAAMGQSIPRRFPEIGRGSEANAMYGLGFWSNQAAGRADAQELSVERTLGQEFPAAFWGRSCLAKAAPPDLIAMIGSGGQRCYLVPSYGLVIVRFGKGSAFRDADFLNILFGRR